MPLMIILIFVAATSGDLDDNLYLRKLPNARTVCTTRRSRIIL